LQPFVTSAADSGDTVADDSIRIAPIDGHPENEACPPPVAKATLPSAVQTEREDSWGLYLEAAVKGEVIEASTSAISFHFIALASPDSP